MLSEKRFTSWAGIGLFVFLLAAALFTNINAIQRGFLFADEAIYYSMTQSLARDGDIEYTRQDLIRYNKEFPSGPLGIFLKKGREGRIFFAKSFAYPLFAAPFVRILGSNGFLVFNILLLGLVLLMGTAYFNLSNSPLISLSWILTFLFTSVAAVYSLWISPDFFNLALVFSILFLWLYKHRRIPAEEVRREKWRFLSTAGTDYLAAALAGIAFFSKPPNVVLIGILVLFYLLRRNFIRALVIVLIFLLTAALFLGTNYLVTGDWNYQGGERKTFYGRGGYPLERPDLTFESARGDEMTSENYSDKHLLPPQFIAYNLYYYFAGRFTGVIWYFFPAFFCLILFIFSKKRLDGWLILAALTAEILIYILLMPDNYSGGGGTLANRYFLSIYPLFLFLPQPERKPWQVGLCWGIACFFTAQILINPIAHSHYPDTHTKRFPFKWLPVEMTLVNNFPTNTNPWAFRQTVGIQPDIGWLHFLDGNFLGRSRDLREKGFWTRGSEKAEMILKTYYPVRELVFQVLNNPRPSNRITVQVGGQKKAVTLGSRQRATLTFSQLKAFRIESLYLFKIKVKADKDSIPSFESGGSSDRRHLGVYFELEIIPEK